MKQNENKAEKELTKGKRIKILEKNMSKRVSVFKCNIIEQELLYDICELVESIENNEQQKNSLSNIENLLNDMVFLQSEQLAISKKIYRHLQKQKNLGELVEEKPLEIKNYDSLLSKNIIVKKAYAEGLQIAEKIAILAKVKLHNCAVIYFANILTNTTENDVILLKGEQILRGGDEFQDSLIEVIKEKAYTITIGNGVAAKSIKIPSQVFIIVISEDENDLDTSLINAFDIVL